MEPKVTIRKATGEKVYESPADLKDIERIARLLDSRFTIPGTNIRFGLDPIFSLLPVFGDLITYLVSAMLIYMMHQRGASKEVVIKMIINSTLDAAVGAIPVVGTIFDVFYRSNDRNIKLLKEHYFEGKHRGSGTGLLIIIVLVAVAAVVGISYAIWKLIGALLNA